MRSGLVETSSPVGEVELIARDPLPPIGQKTLGSGTFERSNLTVRTMQRRFTRLTCAFSRKMENLRAACALHFAYYNFVWQPRTLGGPSPAMAAGATERLWKVADLVGDC